jgi:lipoate---protein ligase
MRAVRQLPSLTLQCLNQVRCAPTARRHFAGEASGYANRRLARAADFTSIRLNELSHGVLRHNAGPLIFHLSSDNPYFNLSVEHYLLTQSHPDSHILLFYTNRPCVVIGRNQNPWLETDLKRLREGLPVEPIPVSKKPRELNLPDDDREAELKESGRTHVNLVRRRSGGGTVFHDHGNLNFSVIVPNNKAFTRRVHAEMIAQALRPLPGSGSAYGHHYSYSDVKVNDRNDIVMLHKNDKSQWLKCSGSAFKLTRSRALHHGTLLISSPYIDRISDLLRSPGRDFISAKGVESVRSKVSNLTQTPLGGRGPVLLEIVQAITAQFWEMYGEGQQRSADNEMAIAAPINLDDLEVADGQIANGVKELMSSAWIFKQTPSFDFDSGILDHHSVNFNAKSGAIKFIKLRNSVPGPEGSDGDQPRREKKLNFRVNEAESNYTPGDIEGEFNLHEIPDWKTFLDQALGARSQNNAGHGTMWQGRSAGQLPSTLIQRLNAIFPKYDVSWPDGSEYPYGDDRW